MLPLKKFCVLAVVADFKYFSERAQVTVSVISCQCTEWNRKLPEEKQTGENER